MWEPFFKNQVQWIWALLRERDWANLGITLLRLFIFFARAYSFTHRSFLPCFFTTYTPFLPLLYIFSKKTQTKAQTTNSPSSPPIKSPSSPKNIHLFKKRNPVAPTKKTTMRIQSILPSLLLTALPLTTLAQASTASSAFDLSSIIQSASSLAAVAATNSATLSSVLSSASEAFSSAYGSAETALSSVASENPSLSSVYASATGAEASALSSASAAVSSVEGSASASASASGNGAVGGQKEVLGMGGVVGLILAGAVML